MFDSKFNVNDYTQVEIQAAFTLLESRVVQDYIAAEMEVEKSYEKSYGNGSAYDARVNLLDGTKSNGDTMSYSERSAALDAFLEYERGTYVAIGAASVYQRICRDAVWNFASTWNSKNPERSVSAGNIRRILNAMFEGFGIHTL